MALKLLPHLRLANIVKDIPMVEEIPGGMGLTAKPSCYVPTVVQVVVSGLGLWRKGTV